MNKLSRSRSYHLPDIDSPVHYRRSYIEQKDGATYSDDRNYGFHLLSHWPKFRRSGRVAKW